MRESFCQRNIVENRNASLTRVADKTRQKSKITINTLKKREKICQSASL